MAEPTDGWEGHATTSFHGAVALAASLVEGTATTVDADHADAMHDPLVAAALVLRGDRDPVFAMKLAGRHGTWVGRPEDASLLRLDEDALATAYVARLARDRAPDAG